VQGTNKRSSRALNAARNGRIFGRFVGFASVEQTKTGTKNALFSLIISNKSTNFKITKWLGGKFLVGCFLREIQVNFWHNLRIMVGLRYLSIACRNGGMCFYPKL
jgi:hypothetical protein